MKKLRKITYFHNSKELYLQIELPLSRKEL